jgi:hypothetical protein
MPAFCKKCGNLLHARKTTTSSVLFCSHCGATTSPDLGAPLSLNPLFVDQDFRQNKLKPLLRTGRDSKPIRSLARQLNVPETELHELFKQLDTENKLPYGYYDKIERVYCRTHVDEDIDEDLLIDMVKQAYEYKVFHHQGLTAFIRLGRQTTSRKVLNSLHQLRKNKKIIGFKKGSRWLWRLPDPDQPEGKIAEQIENMAADSALHFENDYNEADTFSADKNPPTSLQKRLKKSRKQPTIKRSAGQTPPFHKKTFIISGIDDEENVEEPETHKSEPEIESELNRSEDDDLENENISLAELARSIRRPSDSGSADDDDDDDDFEIIFADDSDEDNDTD